MGFLVQDVIPRWYSFFWDSANTAIRLWVHPEFAATLTPVLPTAPVVLALTKELKLMVFQGSFKDSRFGFEGSIRFERKSDGAFEFTALIPRVYFPTRRRCDRCKGQKVELYDKTRPCFFCNGTGKEHMYRWHRAEAVAASLGVLLVVMEYPNIKTHDARPQLMTVHGYPHHGSCSIGGTFSIPLVRWLRSFSQYTDFPEIEQAMVKAYHRMTGRKWEERYFRATIYGSHGELCLDCPGDACNVHACESRSGERGYDITCHNLDTPVQHLSLLAGLAALHDLADTKASPSTEEA